MAWSGSIPERGFFDVFCSVRWLLKGNGDIMPVKVSLRRFAPFLGLLCASLIVVSPVPDCVKMRRLHRGFFSLSCCLSSFFHINRTNVEQKIKFEQFLKIFLKFSFWVFRAILSTQGGYQKRWDYFVIEKNLKKNRKNFRPKSERYFVHFKDIRGDQKTLVSKFFDQLFQKKFQKILFSLMN